jgi:ABC-2 type transport system ATP-binding protein
MRTALTDILLLYKIADLPHRHWLLTAFIASQIALAFLELIGLASIGAFVGQMLQGDNPIDIYFVSFESLGGAVLFVLLIWIFRSVCLVLLNWFNFSFTQRIKSGLQAAQCNVAFASRSRSDQAESGKLFTALTNEDQMLVGRVFNPFSIAFAEVILIIFFAIAALYVMPLGTLVAGGSLVTGYIVIQVLISPLASAMGEARTASERVWTGKLVNTFLLRREAQVYGVLEAIKANLVSEMRASNVASGRFNTIAPLNRAAIETVGVVSVLGLLLFSSGSGGSGEAVIFIMLAMGRLLPSGTRIMAAIQSYKFAKPVIDKQLAYLNKDGEGDQPSLPYGFVSSHGDNLLCELSKNVDPCRIEISLSTPGLIVISGESGLGKTTLLESIVDFLIDQQALGEDYARELSYSSQNNLVTEMDVEQNLRFYRDIRAERLSAGKKLLVDWGLMQEAFDMDRRVTDFSGGEKKRVSVARALNCDDTIILLDEPTSGLNAGLAAGVTASIVEKAKTNLIIAVTHDQWLIKNADLNFNLVRVAEDDEL